MKRLLFGIFCMLFCGVCNSAQIVNVEYIHKLIEQQYGITVPYNSELTNPHVAANMKYLLTTIDAANSILNGEQITDYGTSEYATNVATDTVAALEMVRDHVRDYKFFATTTPDTTSFSFSISASGVFHIDWGDGTRESYRKNNTTTTTYSHEYPDAGEYVIKIGGYRTGGNSISFNNNLNLAKIEGSLGAIFSTIKNKNGTVSNPSFGNIFNGCTNLTGEIPPDLFRGVYGQPIHAMFYGTFWNCPKLTGSIPDALFGGLSGTYAVQLFTHTFAGCTGLTGSIPADLFGDLYGQPARSMFETTFNNCQKLTGVIPKNLFGKISGTPKPIMFYGTFNNCRGLTGVIPDGLFGDIYGDPAVNMFARTFSGCSGLTGEIPENLFAGISGNPANNMYQYTFSGCSGLTGSIPENLFAGISGNPANDMYLYTFSGCSGLTGSIPDKLFGDLYGAPAANMFAGTFSGCSGLTGEIPEDLFGNISGDAQNYMFYSTFAYVGDGLTGPSAKINGQYLYEIWPDATTTQVGGMYRGATGLTDYADIPSPWK